MSNTKGHRSWGHVRQQATKGKLWQASYVGPDGLRHFAPTTFTHRSDAESWLGKERRLVENDSLGEATWIAPRERALIAKVAVDKLKDYAATDIAQRTLKPRTRIHYTTMLTDHIEPQLGNVPMNRLTPAMIRAWYAKTLVDSPTYRKHAYDLLKSICNTAVKDGLLDRNPCTERISRAKTKHDMDILTADELAAVADAIKPERFKALVLLSAWCALRFGEATELRRKDISDDCSTLSITRGVVHRPSADSDKRCYVGTTKSGESRTVVIPPHIRAEHQAPSRHVRCARR